MATNLWSARLTVADITGVYRHVQSKKRVHRCVCTWNLTLVLLKLQFSALLSYGTFAPNFLCSLSIPVRIMPDTSQACCICNSQGNILWCPQNSQQVKSSQHRGTAVAITSLFVQTDQHVGYTVLNFYLFCQHWQLMGDLMSKAR